MLNRLKDNFNKEFKIEHEPKREQGSQPDFRVSFQGLNIGYIENKRVGTNLNQLLESDQIRKYLELNPNLMLTDYLNFVWALSLLGVELIGLHVLNQESLNYSFEKLKDATIGESGYIEAHERNPIISKPSHNDPEKRIYINHSAYFSGVSQEIYDYRIGGYCVLDKYLKSHKNESCDFDRVTNIIKVIARTIEIQKTLGFLTSDLPHLKGNDSKALMQEILQNPPPPI